MGEGISRKLARQQAERAKKDEERRKDAIAKAEAYRKREEARIKAEEEAKFWRENEALRKKMEEEERIKREIERKTKVYYKLGNYDNERIDIPLNPTFFGEHISDERNQAWIPHGEGEFRVDDVPITKGVYHKGFLQGAGHQLFDDGQKWEGEFKRSYMHGVGMYTGDKESKPREALARDGVIMCFKDELQQGMQVEFDDPTLFVVTNTRRPRASIMCHVRGWKYKVHWHDEIKPRERDLVFTNIKRFRVLHELPRIYHSTPFGQETDPPKRYDYFEDVYGKEHTQKHGEPWLGIAEGRRTINMKFHGANPLVPYARNKYNASVNRDNVFESAEVGVGAARAEEEKEKLKELKKKQFEALIEERRAAAEAERKAAIEAEQKKILEEDTAKQKEQMRKQREQEAAEKADFEASMEAAKAEASASVD
jgi:hypothetical protein